MEISRKVCKSLTFINFFVYVTLSSTKLSVGQAWNFGNWGSLVNNLFRRTRAVMIVVILSYYPCNCLERPRETQNSSLRSVGMQTEIWKGDLPTRSNATHCSGVFLPRLFIMRGTRWHSWLRHCSTTGRSWVLFQMVSLEFFIDIILPAALWSTQSLIELSNRNIFWVVRWPVHRADHLTTIICRLSWNLGASTFWNPQNLYMPLQELLYSSLWSSRMISVWLK